MHVCICLDIVIHLLGYPVSNLGLSSAPPPQDTSGTTAQDHVYGLSLFPNNVLFNGSWCFAVPANEVADECVLVGTSGSIKFSFFGTSGTVILTKETETHGSTTEEWDFLHPLHIQGPMISKVIAYFTSDTATRGDHNNGDNDGGGECNNGGDSLSLCQNSPNPCSIQDALVVMQMIDAYSQSYTQTGRDTHA